MIQMDYGALGDCYFGNLIHLLKLVIPFDMLDKGH